MWDLLFGGTCRPPREPCCPPLYPPPCGAPPCPPMPMPTPECLTVRILGCDGCGNVILSVKRPRNCGCEPPPCRRCR